MIPFLIPLLIVLFLCTCVRAQQTIRGTLLDGDTKQPLPFVTVVVLGTKPLLGATSDLEGVFRIENVRIGRYDIAASYLGYEPVTRSNVEVGAGKEVVLNFELIESVTQIEEVVVTAGREKGGRVNDLATVSARSLSLDEANRYAASISDPARQAQNFAGVAGGGDDLSNEIVIRGNSPRGLLWQLEGIEIPNPNHFGEAGASGGGVSMLSSQVLATSDFLTGAFPAEYGNALSGVFDLRYRKGNNEQREFTAAAGFLGLELAAEGPFVKGAKSSYLVNYRFSTLSILDNLGVSVAGDFLPNYQDVNFNLTFPTDKFGVFNLFGLVGNNWSAGDLLPEADETGPEEREEGRALTAVAGLRNRYILGDNTYLSTILSLTSVTSSYLLEEKVGNDFRLGYRDKFDNGAVRISSTVNHKFSAQHLLRVGFIGSRLSEAATIDARNTERLSDSLRLNSSGSRYQAFAHWRWRLGDKLTLNSGLHYLYNELNRNGSLEPRLGASYALSAGQDLNLALGIHSRADDAIVYREFSGLQLPRALHAVAGYDRRLGRHGRLKAELYYQYLYNIPVSPVTGFSGLNARSVFEFIEDEQRLTNGGSGRNFGVELTVERFLHEGLYYLATVSLYRAQYSTDGRDYFSTPFDGGYVANALAGKEWKLNKTSLKHLGLNLRLSAAGGQRYTGFDAAASTVAMELVEVDTPFGEQIDGYYRADVGISYKVNRPKTTHHLSLNLQNVTNRANPFQSAFTFDAQTATIRERKQLQSGLLPILKYRVEF